MRSIRSALMAATALAVISSMDALADAVPTLRSSGSGNNRRPTPPRLDATLAREIAEHNEAVERRKAEKKAAKHARRVGVA